MTSFASGRTVVGYYTCCYTNGVGFRNSPNMQDRNPVMGAKCGQIFEVLMDPAHGAPPGWISIPYPNPNDWANKRTKVQWLPLGLADGTVLFTPTTKTAYDAWCHKHDDPKHGDTSKGPSRMHLSGSVHKALRMVEQCVIGSSEEINLKKDGVADKVVPRSIIGQCKGIAFLTQVKAGFVFSGSIGVGLVMAKLPGKDGGPPRWSAPSSIGTAGMGWGLQIGATKTDSMIILNNSQALSAFSGQGQVKLGGNVSVAAGPIGREADAAVSGGDGGVAACFTYSFSKGLFAGLALQGAVIATRDDDNRDYYGQAVNAHAILAGNVAPPAQAEVGQLQQILTQVCNEWNEEQARKKANLPKKKPPPVPAKPKQPPVPAKPAAAAAPPVAAMAAATISRPKFCGNCGAKFPDDVANFCNACGAKRG